MIGYGWLWYVVIHCDIPFYFNYPPLSRPIFFQFFQKTYFAPAPLLQPLLLLVDMWVETGSMISEQSFKSIALF